MKIWRFGDFVIKWNWKCGDSDIRKRVLHADPVGRRMTGSAFSGVPLGRSGADRFIRKKRDDIEKIGGGFGGGWAKYRSVGRSIGG